MKSLARRAVSLVSAGGLLYLGGSYLGARVLADRLLSPEGLGPTPDRRDELLSALRAETDLVAELRHEGSARLPVELSAVFASPGKPDRRPTILFLHGKGGNASEWGTDAVRAVRLGYNALIPDLRGHGRSGGTVFTLGYLEKEDLALAVAAARDGFGIDSGRIGIHSCSAGSSVALEFAAGRAGIRAIWLESPFAQPREMARRYLSLATRIPAPLLTLTSRWAIARAVTRLKRELGAEDRPGGLELLDPLRAVARVSAPILLVYGEEDRLVPPRFVRRLAEELPPLSETWNAAGSGHCHHANEPQAVVKEEYERRWREFFSRHVPV